MMRTRCPVCHSIFRVTPEQTQMKAGKVRCGHCHEVFNALDNLLGEPAAAQSPATGQAAEPSAPCESVQGATSLPETVSVVADAMVAEAAKPDLPPLESARVAGLVAARELSETPAFNRWAAGTMATDGSIGLDAPVRRRRRRGWRVAAVVLLLLLAAQAVYNFRSDLVAHEPRLGPIFAALAVDVPPPAHGALISVESTELRANGAGPGLLLGVTLKNRAPYAQAWPMLELTLTDTSGKIVARRVFSPADYLAAERLQAGFPAHGEVGVKLLLDAGDLPATGYSLYAFYP